MALHITGDPTADRALERRRVRTAHGHAARPAGPRWRPRSRDPRRSGRGSARSTPRRSPATTPRRSSRCSRSGRRCTASRARWPGACRRCAAAVRDDWGGDASAIWTQGDPDGAEVLKRLQALPGFGEQKAKIFLALLGKQRGLAGARLARGRRALRRGGIIPRRSPTSSTRSRSRRCGPRSRRRRLRQSRERVVEALHYGRDQPQLQADRSTTFRKRLLRRLLHACLLRAPGRCFPLRAPRYFSTSPLPPSSASTSGASTCSSRGKRPRKPNPQTTPRTHGPRGPGR